MKKLKLDLDALAVESFAAEAAAHAQLGTVRAWEATRLADTCGCQDTTRVGACFCTEYVSCFDCTVA